MTVGLQPEIPPLCNLPIVSSALGLPFLSFGKRAGAFIAPHYYFLPVSALMSEPSGGWTEKKKMMEVAPSCGAVGLPVGEEVSSCQFGPPRESPPPFAAVVGPASHTQRVAALGALSIHLMLTSGLGAALSPGWGDTRGKKS